MMEKATHTQPEGLADMQQDDSLPASGSRMRRLSAVLLRHAYLYRSSWPRIVELMYWPTLQMILWGFITLYLRQHSTVIATATGLLVTGVLLWEILFRGQLGFSLSFLEEIWSRNLVNLFVSPLRPWEFIASLTILSFLRTLIGVGPAALLAIALYDVSVFQLGLPLVAFFTCLIVMGWSIGLMVCALVLRVGLGAESAAWIAIFLIIPISAVYYPVSVLPDWLQPLAWSLPPAPVFEGMRAVLLESRFDLSLLMHAIALDIVYFMLGLSLFFWSYRVARKRGLILQIGE